MLKFALLVAALATPAYAETKAALSQETTPIRVDYVYEYAKSACPKSKDIAARSTGPEGSQFINRVARLSLMTDSEQVLLYHMCELYVRGITDGVSPH